MSGSLFYRFFKSIQIFYIIEGTHEKLLLKKIGDHKVPNNKVSIITGLKMLLGSQSFWVHNLINLKFKKELNIQYGEIMSQYGVSR